MHDQDVLTQLRDAGLLVDALDTSGALQRVPVEGDRGSKRSGWYVARSKTITRTGLCGDCGGECRGHHIVYGHYGNYKAGLDLARIDATLPRLSDEEYRALKAKMRRDREDADRRRAELARTAATRAAKLWGQLPDEGRSPYLDRKKVRAFNLRFARDGAIVVPVFGRTLELVGLQFIASDGTKRFLTGTAKAGASFRIGRPGPDPVPYVICEGYATGASVHMATGWPVVVCFDAGNILPVAADLREVAPDARIIIAADDDHATAGNPGRTKAAEAAQRIQGEIALPVFASPLDAGTDFNDLHVAEGLDAVRACLLSPQAALRAEPQEEAPARSEPRGEEPAEDSRWQDVLTRTKTGEIKPDIYNVTLVLENDRAWQGVLGYCDFSYRIVKRRAPPIRDGKAGEWTDADTTRLRVWMAERYRFTPKTGDVDEAVMLVAQSSRFHPVREYLEAVMWDERPRVDTWLSRYLGATDSEYTRAVGRYWLIAAVARVMRPPVKADCVLILEGLQGLGKSTALEILGGKWFSDTHFALGEKDGYQQMSGLWICELAELDSFNKAESTRAKQFFGSKEDRYRPPYGRRTETFARQCVFAGSTNQDSYLKDATGNRRYWPITCSALEDAALRSDRDQLWAEAMHLYLQGARWWPGDDEKHLFADEQEKRFASDAWEDVLKEYLTASTAKFYTVAEVAHDALGLQHHQLKPPEEQRIGRVMGRLGWKRARPRQLRDGIHLRLWGYERPPGWGETDEA